MARAIFSGMLPNGKPLEKIIVTSRNPRKNAITIMNNMY